MKTTAAAQAEVLPTDTPARFDAAVTRAVQLLRAGEVVALPTETVYGLAADARDEQAVAKIFQIKGRPAHNPIIVHVAGPEMARRCAAEWPPLADALARAFWPGPLTLVLRRAAGIPVLVTAGGPTVGIRWPSHPFMQAVIRSCEFPLAAPSANLSAAVSPTTAGHVVKSLGGRVRLIVDGGASQVGIESTVVDLTIQPPRVLRPGMIHRESLSAVAGNVADAESSARVGGSLRSPGLLPKHYAPKARLSVLSWRDAGDLRAQLSVVGLPPSEIQVIAHTRIPTTGDCGEVQVLPRDPEAFARAIYGALHRADETGASVIVVEALPETAEWEAINDRLRRARA